MSSLHLRRSPVFPIDARLFWAAIAAFAVVYVIKYLSISDLPGADPGSPLGWWAWFDQGEYLKAARAWHAGEFSVPQHTYPPLYALAAAPWIKSMPQHPFFPIDLFGFLFFLGVLFWIGGRLYGLVTTLVAVALVIALYPFASARQWVIPWTSTMSVLLVSVQFATAWALYNRPSRWRMTSRLDWLYVGLFFVSLSGLAATRPLDFLTMLPFSAYVFARLQIETWRAVPADRRMGAALVLFAFCAGLCAICAALLVGFNLYVYGGIVGDYVWNTSGNGYFVADIPEKAYSIFLHSGSVYSEAGVALFEKFPLFGVIFAIALVALFSAKSFVRCILLTGFLQIALYLPYGDLMPTAVIRFGEIHYFKWIFLWFAVIALGEMVSWFRQPLSVPARLARIVPLAAILLFFWTFALKPVAVTDVAGLRDIGANTIDIAGASADGVSYVDIPSLAGGFDDFYFGRNAVTLNGEPLVMVREYRFIMSETGARLVFIRPRHIDALHIAFDRRVTVEPNPAPLSLTTVGPGFGGAI